MIARITLSVICKRPNRVEQDGRMQMTLFEGRQRERVLRRT